MEIKIDIVSEEGTDLLAPSHDFIFKTIFGLNERKAELISLLNAILNGNPHVKDLTIENSEIPKDIKNGKSVRLDISATSGDRTKFSVEIQCSNTGNVMNRSEFYQSKRMPGELQEGQTYDSMPNFISIWFTTYKETKRRYHTSEAVYMFKESRLDPVEVASEKFRTFIVELEKIDLSKADPNNMFDVWSYFLIAPEEMPKEFLEVEEVKKAMNTLGYVSHDREQRRIYNSILKARNDEINAMAYAKNEGRDEGRVEGRTEREKEMARSLLSAGVDINIIANSSGLSLDQIQSLRSH
ncbi:MAG: Rpn family recombination-promoting nuclease/putative transposase [Holosporaceae bacterium]|jgi:predicted transposase/invertase (TIGR01784 family)|nr:Rpn family recombination-promoting nuclease/putative transposase [Holosporaceae bacterium]